MKIRLKFGRSSQVTEVDGDSSPSNLQQTVLALFTDLKCDFKLSLNKKDALEDDKSLADQGIVSGDLVHVIGESDNVNSPPVVKRPLLLQEWTDSVTTSSGRVGQGNYTRTVYTGAAAGSSRHHTEESTMYMSSGAGFWPNSQSSSSCEHVSETSQSTETSRSPHSGHQTSDMDTQEQLGDEKDEQVDHVLVNRYLNEPMLCRESQGIVVPAILVQVYQSLGQITHPADALCVVLHILMLETGYTGVHKKDSSSDSASPEVDGAVTQTNLDSTTPQTISDTTAPRSTSDSTCDGADMPDGWQDKPGQFCLTYSKDTCTEEKPKFVLTCVQMGNILVVNGRLQGDGETWSCHLNLNTKEFIRKTDTDAGSCYKNLGKLSRVFKDAIALPLLQQFRTGGGLPPQHGILAISHEVKLKILGKLDAVSVLQMSESCREFNGLCKDRYVWRRVYLKDFGNRSNNALAQDWSRLYRQEYKLRKERRRIWKRNPMPMFMPPVVPSFGLPPPGPFHPGILNGDHDLDPFFGQYDRRLLPNSQIDQRIHPGSVLFRPRFDPMGPLPEHNILPGRSRRDNRGGFGGVFGGPRMF